MGTTKPFRKRKPKRPAAGASAGAPAPVAQAEPAPPPAAEECVLRLPDSLQVKDVETCRQQLLAALSGGRAPRLDLGALASIDTAGVQLLVAFRAEARKNGWSLSFSGESPVLTEATAALGLEWGSVP